MLHMTEELLTLSERELEVLQLVATGATNQQIARELVISPNTVKVHLRNIFEKLGVQSRTEAATEAIRRGLVRVPGDATGLPGLAPTFVVAPSDASLTVASPVLDWLPERSAPRMVVPWQRAYLLAALLLALLAAFAPAWRRVGGESVSSSHFTDSGRSQNVAPARVEAARWGAGAALPQARSRHALVARDSLLYAIGGETADGVSDAFTVYDARENAWRAGPAKPTAVANISAAIIGDLLLVPGGSTADGVTAVLEAYNLGTETWETRTPLPSPRAAAAVASLDGQLYLFGGWDGVAYRADTYRYDPDRDTWSVVSPLPAPRAFHGASALKGLIYVVGGFDGRRELNDVLAYDPAREGYGDPWSARAPMQEARAGLGLAALGTRIYAVGGGWQSPVTFNEQYDTQVDAWSRIGTPLAAQWRNLGLAALDQKLYAVGGWSDAYLAVNEQYLALLRQLLPIGGRSGG